MVGKLLIGLGVLTVASGLVAQPAMTTMRSESGPQQIDRTSQAEDVKFRNEAYQRMTVPVTLSGSGPYRFMVDTGADRTAISRELAAKLQLVVGARASLHSVAGVSSVDTADVPNLQLTRRAVKVVDAPLLDSANIGADGILGVDSLRSQRIQFDFTKNVMSIVPAASPERITEPDAIVIEAARRNGRLVLADARIDGRSVTVVLDTGSQVSIGNLALRTMLIGRQPADPSQQVELESVTGAKIIGDYTFLNELSMGGVGLRHLAVVFADAHTFRKLGLYDKPALLLGMNAIRAFKKVSIDFANLKFRVVLPESSALGVELARTTIRAGLSAAPL